MRQRNYLNVRQSAMATENVRWESLGSSFIAPFTPFTPSPAPYFLPDLYLYSAARLTRGFWVPIRPPCPSPLGVGIPNLDHVCKNGPVPPLTLSVPENTYLSSSLILSPELQASGVQDFEGRILCDEKRRTPTQQMSDSFDDDFMRRSFILTN
jgi:hypothetical protein